jgi:cell division protease FtsH
MGGKHTSDETAKKIDEEVRRIIDEAYATARQILVDNTDKLHAMSRALMQFETLDSDQIDDIMCGRAPRPPADAVDSGSKPGSGAGAAEDRGPGAAPIGDPAGEH